MTYDNWKATNPSDRWLGNDEEENAMAYTDQEIQELVREALAEDEREGSHFDVIGFAQFFPEHDPDAVRAAWKIYEAKVYGGEP